MKNNRSLRAPLKSWDIFSISLQRQSEKFNRETEIQILNAYKEKYAWTFNVDCVLSNNKYDAIVLTNAKQEIEWVNKGFVKMTGYSASFSIGKTPRFLQGKDSSKKVLKTIYENIKKRIYFEETIINYRKNTEEYNCNIKIFPLCNKNDKICHLLALEREVQN